MDQLVVRGCHFLEDSFQLARPGQRHRDGFVRAVACLRADRPARKDPQVVHKEVAVAGVARVVVDRVNLFNAATAGEVARKNDRLRTAGGDSGGVGVGRGQRQFHVNRRGCIGKHIGLPGDVVEVVPICERDGPECLVGGIAQADPHAPAGGNPAVLHAEADRLPHAQCRAERTLNLRPPAIIRPQPPLPALVKEIAAIAALGQRPSAKPIPPVVAVVPPGVVICRVRGNDNIRRQCGPPFDKLVARLGHGRQRHRIIGEIGARPRVPRKAGRLIGQLNRIDPYKALFIAGLHRDRHAPIQFQHILQVRPNRGRALLRKVLDTLPVLRPIRRLAPPSHVFRQFRLNGCAHARPLAGGPIAAVGRVQLVAEPQHKMLPELRVGHQLAIHHRRIRFIGPRGAVLFGVLHIGQHVELVHQTEILFVYVEVLVARHIAVVQAKREIHVVDHVAPAPVQPVGRAFIAHLRDGTPRADVVAGPIRVPHKNVRLEEIGKVVQIHPVLHHGIVGCHGQVVILHIGPQVGIVCAPGAVAAVIHRHVGVSSHVAVNLHLHILQLAQPVMVVNVALIKPLAQIVDAPIFAI